MVSRSAQKHINKLNSNTGATDIDYFQNGTGDANDVWKIVDIDGRSSGPLKTVTTRFMLVHYLQNCALTTSGKQLPKWAFEQQEVTCNPNLRDRNAQWNVEDNSFAKRM